MIHEALIYGSDAEYTAVLAPFLAEAVSRSHGAVAITTPDRIRLLQRALGPAGRGVTFVESGEWYRRPGATLVAWRAVLGRYPATEPVHAVGEVPFVGDEATVERWTRYESLFNQAFADRAGWVVCPYDARALPPAIVAQAMKTHPVTSSRTARAPSPEYFAEPELGRPVVGTVERRSVRWGPAVELAPDFHPVELRRAVVWAARAAGIGGDVLEDLVVAAGDVAAEGGTVRTGSAGAEWICEVAGGGATTDRRFGVLVGRLVCDSVEVEAGLVRFVFGTASAGARGRILAAGAELFAEKGPSAAGVNEIIARAGVARGTFYAHFPSKQDLVAAWHEGAGGRCVDGLRDEVEARAPVPAERVTTLFEVLPEWLAAGGAHDEDVQPYVRELAHAAGVDDIADELHVLVEGVLAGGSARAAGAAAARLSR